MKANLILALGFALFSAGVLSAEPRDLQPVYEDYSGQAYAGSLYTSTCTAIPVADPSNGNIWCSITKYCGLFGGKTTLTSTPLDNPPCSCECR